MPKNFVRIRDLIWPTLKAIKALGGSGSNREINQKVIELESYSEEIQNKPHANGSQTELEYKLAWARTMLKGYGALENIGHNVWRITSLGENLTESDVDRSYHEKRRQRRQRRANQKVQAPNTDSNDFNSVTSIQGVQDSNRDSNDSNLVTSMSEDNESNDTNNSGNWKTGLLKTLQEKVSPSGFEKLIQRILRESGFVKVKVTGQVGDGGVDGVGILKVGLLSFRVVFQCKRFSEPVTLHHIRDFRGAMQGRSEKGLFMTTGHFTSKAREEASRKGAPLIDLFDGDDICELINDLKLGCIKESISINSSWFEEEGYYN